MASEASMAEPTAGKAKGCKVVETMKINDDLSQQQIGVCEIGKDRKEIPESFDTVDQVQIAKGNNEESEMRVMEKEDEDVELNVAPTSGGLGVKKDVSSIDDAKMEKENSDFSASEALINNKCGASLGVDAKSYSVATETTGFFDANSTETSSRNQKEKSLGTAESLDDVVEKTELVTGLCLVQESKKVVHESQVPDEVVGLAKGTVESTGFSCNLDEASEHVVTSEDHPVALSIIESASDASEKLERKNEIAKADDVLEVLEKVSIAVVNVATEHQFLEESAVEALDGGSSSQTLHEVTSSNEVKPIEIHKNFVSENEEQISNNDYACGFTTEAHNEELNATKHFRKGTENTSLPDPINVVLESKEADMASDAAETIVKPDINNEEEKAVNSKDVDLKKEKKEVLVVTEMVNEVDSGKCPPEPKNEKNEQVATKDLGKEVITDTILSSQPVPVIKTEPVDATSVVGVAEPVLKCEMENEEQKEEENLTEHKAEKNEKNDQVAAVGMSKGIITETILSTPPLPVVKTEPIDAAPVINATEHVLKCETLNEEHKEEENLTEKMAEHKNEKNGQVATGDKGTEVINETETKLKRPPLPVINASVVDTTETVLKYETRNEEWEEEENPTEMTECKSEIDVRLASEELGKVDTIDTSLSIPCLSVVKTEPFDAASVVIGTETAFMSETEKEEQKEHLTKSNTVSNVATEVSDGQSMEYKSEYENDKAKGLEKDISGDTNLVSSVSSVTLGETSILASSVSKYSENNQSDSTERNVLGDASFGFFIPSVYPGENKSTLSNNIAPVPRADLEENVEEVAERSFKEGKIEEARLQEQSAKEGGEKTEKREPALADAKETEASSIKGSDIIAEPKAMGAFDTETQFTDYMKTNEISGVGVQEELAEMPKSNNKNARDNKTSAISNLDQIEHTSLVSEVSSGEERAIDDADKVVKERNLVDFEPAMLSAEDKQETLKVTEDSAEEPQHENEQRVDDKALTQTSKDTLFGGETDTSAKEATKLLEEKSEADAAKKDDAEKKAELEKIDAQDFVRSSKDLELKPDMIEAPAKSSKTLMSKVKHSIVKVKKAITGKSSSSKSISVDSKDELKVK